MWVRGAESYTHIPALSKEDQANLFGLEFQEIEFYWAVVGRAEAYLDIRIEEFTGASIGFPGSPLK